MPNHLIAFKSYTVQTPNLEVNNTIGRPLKRGALNVSHNVDMEKVVNNVCLHFQVHLNQERSFFFSQTVY